MLLINCTTKESKSSDTSHSTFFAIIVEDMEQSKTWYTDKLGFEIVNSREVIEIGLKQANLKRNTVNLELIELSSAISLKDSISEFNSKTKVKGLFKVGFTVRDFDTWIEELKRENVTLNGSVVIDKITGKRMVIILDIDGNRIQIFEE